MSEKVSYTAKQVRARTGVTHHQMRYWDRGTGLVKPSVQQTGGRPGVQRLYSEEDVSKIEVVLELMKSVTLQRIHAVVRDGVRNKKRDPELVFFKANYLRDFTEEQRELLLQLIPEPDADAEVVEKLMAV